MSEQTEVTAVLYPDVEVELVGTDGNAFALIGLVQKAIRREVGIEQSKAFSAEALKQGSYDELLQFILSTVEVS